MRKKKIVKKPIRRKSSPIKAKPQAKLEPVVVKPIKLGNCFVCGNPIPKERVEGLILLEKPQAFWSCVSCSTEKKVKGIYMGESGTSELKLVDKVYQDSVRDIFRKTTVEAEEDPVD